MIDVINTIKQNLIESGAENIYTAFDTLPVSSKGKFFTVIGVKNFECSKPVFSQFITYIPFKTELEIKVIAPESTSMETLCQYYNDNIGNILDNMTGMSIHISDISIKQDKNICRLLLNVSVHAEGIRKINRQTEENS